MNGFEFLKELRTDTDLRNTPVFVLTSSEAEGDKERAARCCIAGFMVKSNVGPQYSKLANMLTGYASAMVM